MLFAALSSCRGDGARWLSNHYAANDYYCEGEHVVGSWVGRGAEALGILGQSIEPQNAAFLRMTIS